MNARDLTSALRSLDVADPPTALGAASAADRQARTWARIQQLRATDPSGEPVPSSASVARPRRQVGRRIVLAAATLATTVAAAVALPTLTGGDQAFASWTGMPTQLSAQQQAAAARDCRTAQAQGAGSDQAANLERSQPAIAERRGVWTTVVLAGHDGFTALCITDDSAHLFDRGMIGSVGNRQPAMPTGRRELTATVLGVGTFRGRDISLAAGFAGPDVTEVRYRSPSHGEVLATVAHQHFAFWLPGSELESASSTGIPVEVRYRDGSTAPTRLRL